MTVDPQIDLKVAFMRAIASRCKNRLTPEDINDIAEGCLGAIVAERMQGSERMQGIIGVGVGFGVIVGSEDRPLFIHPIRNSYDCDGMMFKYARIDMKLTSTRDCRTLLEITSRLENCLR